MYSCRVVPRSLRRLERTTLDQTRLPVNGIVTERTTATLGVVRRWLLTAVLLVGLLAWGVIAWTGDEPTIGDAPPTTTTTETGTRSRDRSREHVSLEQPAGVAEQPDVIWAVSGTVRDADGEPLSGAHVELRQHGERGLNFWDAPLVVADAILGAAVTGEDGSFEIDTGETAPLVIRVECDGHAANAVSVKTDRPTDVVLARAAPREYLVVDESGEPIEGAEIWPTETALPHGFVTTDARGRVTLTVTDTDLPSVRARGFNTQDAAPAEDVPAGDPIRVVLHEGRIVRGIVVDELGEPLSGIDVDLDQESRRTDESGAFEFIGLDVWNWTYRGGLSLSADAPGLCGGEHIDVWPGDVDVRVVLRKSGTVRGVVVDTSDAPVEGARVRRVVTDADGRFELSDFESGRQFISADVKSAVDGRTSHSGSLFVDVPPGGVVEGVRIVVKSERSASFVRLRVVDEEGAPAARADVMVWVGDEQITDNRVGADGTRLVRLRPRPGLQLRVAAFAKGPPVRDAFVEVNITPTSTAPFPIVDLRLGPPGRLALRAVDANGRPVRLDAALIEPLNDLPLNEDGTWDLPATMQFYSDLVVPGFARKTLRFDPPHARLREETIVLLPAARVFGRVLDHRGGPAPDTANVVAVIYVPGTDQWEWGDVALDEDGRFEMTALPPGDAHFRIFDINDVLHYDTFTINAGVDVDLGTIELAAAVTLTGTVIRPDGAPIGGALVRLLDRGGRELGDAATSRSDGAFRIRVAAAIPVGVRVSRPGFGTLLIATTPTPTPLRVELGPSGRICVHDDDVEFPPGSWWIEARVPGTNWTWRPVELYDIAAGDGGFVADDDGDSYGDLPAGPLEIVLHLGDGRELVRRVDVVAGGTIECVFAE